MEKIKIGLIGYGNMGREIHRIAKAEKFDVCQIFDEDNPIFETNKFDFDVAIDFSIPSVVVDNAEMVAKAGKNLVIGTTGWYDFESTIRQIAIDNNIGIVWGSNFSMGMQLYFKILNYTATLVNKVEDYDIFVHEIHHRRKKDSPSGTAISIGKIITGSVNSKDKLLTGNPYNEIHKNQLHISSTRGGAVPGTHTVYVDSEPDTIELTHRARNRSGFAGGALKAAELIYKKKGFFSFEELLEDFWR